MPEQNSNDDSHLQINPLADGLMTAESGLEVGPDIYEDIYEDLHRDQAMVNDANFDFESEESTGAEEDPSNANHLADDSYVEPDHPNSEIGDQSILNSKLINLISAFNLTNRCVDAVLDVLNFVNDHREAQLKIPSSLYSLNQNFKIDLDTKYGFITPCCSRQLLLSKGDLTRNCPFCCASLDRREVILSSNYQFRFSLSKQIAFLVNKFGLKAEVFSEASIKTVFDSANYKKFRKARKGELIGMLTAFTDGVYLSKTNEIYPIYFAISNLNCPPQQQRFLNSCIKTQNKPKLDFFLEDTLLELAVLSKEGLFIESLNRKVYFFLSNFLMDAVARAYFLCHRLYAAKFGCTDCLHEGSRVPVGNGTANIYPPVLNVPVRSRKLHEFILENYPIDPDRNVSYFGVKGRTPLFDLKYFDVCRDTPFDAMHQFMLGSTRYDLTTSLDSSLSEFKSYISPRNLAIINERIKLFPFSADFKRAPESLDLLKDWKANQLFDFLFYIMPLVFDSLIDQEVYEHRMQFMFILASGWNELELSIIPFLESVIADYLSSIPLFYHNRNLTSNTHSLTHLVATIKRHGPLKGINGFPYESLNGDVKRTITNFYGVINQLEVRYARQFKVELDSGGLVNLDVQALGKPFSYEGRSCFYRILKDKKIYNCSLYKESHKLKTEDCFVQTFDEKLFCILYFFEADGSIFFVGEEFTKLSDFETDLERLNCKLRHKHLINVQQTSNKTVKSAHQISQKVTFVPKFVRGKAEFDDSGLGTIVKTLFIVHN